MAKISKRNGLQKYLTVFLRKSAIKKSPTFTGKRLQNNNEKKIFDSIYNIWIIYTIVRQTGFEPVTQRTIPPL